LSCVPRQASEARTNVLTLQVRDNVLGFASKASHLRMKAFLCEIPVTFNLKINL